MLSWIILLVTGKIPSHLRAFAFLSFSSCQESLCEELYSDACFPLVVKHLSVCWNCLSWLCWCSQSCSITALVIDLGYTTEKAQPCAGMVWTYSPQCELQRETKHQSASGRLLQTPLTTPPPRHPWEGRATAHALYSGQENPAFNFPSAHTCAEAEHNHFLHCAGFSILPFCMLWRLVGLLTANLRISPSKQMVSDHFCWPYLTGCESICGPVPDLSIQWPGELNPWLAGTCQEKYCSI